MQFKNWMWALALIIGLSACQQGGSDVKLEVEKNEEQKIGYAYGVYTAMNMENQSFSDIDQEAFMQGVKDKLKKGDLLVAEDSIFPLLQQYSQKKALEDAAIVKEEGIAFLEKNKTKEGVTVESGLQYEIIEEGEGPMPTLQDNVTTHYHGTLIDGTVFDSSVDRGEPVSFPVSGVISGWTEALQIMKVGSKWKLYVPSDLSYGERGSGPKIKPNSALIFEVQLIRIGEAQGN